MSKQAVFALTVAQELRDEFVAAAEASNQAPSEILVDMMQEFILQQKMAPDYLAFLQMKAEKAREEIASGLSLQGEDVEQEFAARRAAATARPR